MKQVPLRTFQQSASEYINNLPVELTRHGKVIALVVHPDSSIVVDEVTPIPEEEISQVLSPKIIETPKVPEKEWIKSGTAKPTKMERELLYIHDYTGIEYYAVPRMGFCKKLFDRAVQKTYHVRQTDEHDNEIFNDWACFPCINRMVLGKGSVYPVEEEL